MKTNFVLYCLVSKIYEKGFVAYNTLQIMFRISSTVLPKVAADLHLMIHFVSGGNHLSLFGRCLCLLVESLGQLIVG